MDDRHHPLPSLRVPLPASDLPDSPVLRPAAGDASSDPVAGPNIYARLALDTSAFNAAMEHIEEAFRRFAGKTAAAMRAILDLADATRRATRRPTSGHRHRGTRDWTLRYAPARKDVPLGQRTLAKVR